MRDDCGKFFFFVCRKVAVGMRRRSVFEMVLNGRARHMGQGFDFSHAVIPLRHELRGGAFACRRIVVVRAALHVGVQRGSFEEALPVDGQAVPVCWLQRGHFAQFVERNQ